MKNSLACLVVTLLPFLSLSQVNIPDINFETELIAQGIDTDGIVNGQISQIDAEAKTGTLNVNNKGISDLTGIEAFININQLRFDKNSVSSVNLSTLTKLKQLRCAENNLSNLDVSANTKLVQLRFQKNNISSIDISNNVKLKQFYGQDNALTSLNTTANVNLLRIYCSNNSNNLTSLDVSTNTKLTHLIVNGNGLTSLDISTNILLKQLYAQSNDITTLDISNNIGLTKVRIQNNNISILDTSNNHALKELRCQGNNLTELDLSSNMALTFLQCQNNDLTSLIVKNGNTSAFTKFDARNNSNLSCIEVDNVAFAEANFQKPASASFSTNCSLLNDSEFNNINFKIYPNPSSNYINIKTPTSETLSINLYDINGRNILSTSSRKINISSLQSGVYMVKIEGDNKSTTKKFVKI